MTSKYIYSIFTFAYPSYPRRDNFSNISLQNLANRLYAKKELARPDFDCRVLLLTGTNFLHINNRSNRERNCQLLARELRGQLNFSKQGPALQHKNRQRGVCECQLLLEFWLYFWFLKRLLNVLSFTFFNIQMTSQ